MSYIYLDESGCLGFNFEHKKTSKYFVVTFLFVEDKRPVVASRRETNKFLNENFKNYLERTNGEKGLQLKVEIKTPMEEKCLQIVDACSWAIFRKHEHGDEEYYNILKSKIIEENSLF